MAEELAILPFASAQAWEAWLDAHHTTAPGLWLKIAKKDTGIDSLTYAEALDVALCFGWIDGQKAKFDESYWLQRFTPRRKQSKWSQINRAKATALMAAGKLRPAGLREVEAAQQDGRWADAYAAQSKIDVPEDFQAALDAHPTAQAFFDGLNRVNRYAFLYRIQAVKKAETRQRKIDQFIQMLAEHKQIHD
jgi:uncharacterized protein YdeI (YjbR/CyaY-like superfamily)